MNTKQLKDMVGETIYQGDEVVFNADGGEQSGRVVGFKGSNVIVCSSRGKRFVLTPEQVFTDRGADRIVKEANQKRNA